MANRPFSNQEIEITRAAINAGENNAVIAKRLSDAGFTRSVSAIARYSSILRASGEGKLRRAVPASSLVSWAETTLQMSETLAVAYLQELKTLKVPERQTALQTAVRQGGRCYLTGLPFFQDNPESYSPASAPMPLSGDPDKLVLRLVGEVFEGLSYGTIVQVCQRVVATEAARTKANALSV